MNNITIYNFITKVLNITNPIAIKLETQKIINYIQIGKYVDSNLKYKPRSVSEYLKQYRETIRPPTN
jgi:hypothetical protein